MLIIKANLKSGTKSGMRISNESDRKLIETMVGDNIIRKPISFEELALVIDNSHGRVLKYHMDNDLAVYFDSTGRYISDYKNDYGKSNLEGNSEGIKVQVIDLGSASPAENVSMYKGLPVAKKPSLGSQNTAEKVIMYRGSPVLN